MAAAVRQAEGGAPKWQHACLVQLPRADLLTTRQWHSSSQLQLQSTTRVLQQLQPTCMHAAAHHSPPCCSCSAGD